MIRIKRLPPDPVLRAKSQKITDEIFAYLAAREAAKAIAAPPVALALGLTTKRTLKDPELTKLVIKYGDKGLGLKEHLKKESHGKCVYCESKVMHVAHGDIEHVVPKSLRPDLAVSLDNLALACGPCNTNKSDYFNAKAPLVDPHRDDPRREIVFFGWGIARSRCQPRGQHTLRELKLNRKDLSDRREDHFNKLGEIVSSWEKEQDDEVRYALLITIWEHISPEAEYCSMCMTAIEQFRVESLPVYCAL